MLIQNFASPSTSTKTDILHIRSTKKALHIVSKKQNSRVCGTIKLQVIKTQCLHLLVHTAHVPLRDLIRHRFGQIVMFEQLQIKVGNRRPKAWGSIKSLHICRTTLQ